jgi:hypothetical protein
MSMQWWKTDRLDYSRKENSQKPHWCGRPLALKSATFGVHVVINVATLLFVFQQLFCATTFTFLLHDKAPLSVIAVSRYFV